MFWIIATIVLGCITILTLIYNSIKDTKIDALEYEVAYLLFTIFEKDLPKRELSDEDLRKIKDEFNKRMK
ncbi:DUF1514 family protein [Staphylococcus nepalensis]|uniref:DUF1514 family protein n=1 Tax=Staphylococcus nepalensis TaxID=214473 RepID=UPI000E06D543|nr:DUF1514 family protein [Staphylococcus nepalensis]MCD8890991.1 DUF1514 family protein [Staphylococcus nepalensis]RIO43874.1 hypothetical protein BUZ60_03395 [Staphylococcus nepalensis]SUM69827.1 Protein of uncharacterised function (DUF1514) [Staphylococcus nepalensis]SUM96068.1 Protein of uncharacterised function (DUF1514) [Staphylococcus nepalensis]